MLDPQRISTTGSNESQEGLESPPAKEQMRYLPIKDTWLQIIAQKFSHHALNLIRFCFCISIGLVLANNVSASHYSEISNGVIASTDILLDKGLRGVFPPLEGTQDQLVGRWALAVMTEMERTSQKYSTYALNFKRNGDVQITNSECKGDIKYKWYAFYYNMALKPKSNTTTEEQMEIPNQDEDVECLAKDGQFLNILENVSIWTVHLDVLYVVSEARSAADKSSKMMIFRRA